MAPKLISILLRVLPGHYQLVFAGATRPGISNIRNLRLRGPKKGSRPCSRSGADVYNLASAATGSTVGTISILIFARTN